jgi:hypothetical protein
MSCVQDPDLLKHGISVDHFSSEGVQHFLLTHAHSDHMKGLATQFRRKSGGKLYCTQVTRDLTMMTIEGLCAKDFHVVRYGEAVKISDSATIWAFPSYHCDGSCMFLIELTHGDQVVRIVYTGDFRFQPDMRKNSLIVDRVVDRLYYDDTFDEIKIPYPTYNESLTQILSCIALLQDQGHERIHIHCSILGLEPLLREISDTTGYVFCLLPSFKDTWRGAQLKYLLEHRLQKDHHESTQKTVICLGNYKYDHGHEERKKTDPMIPWIIPTCTYFLCDDKHQKRTPPHHYYVWFCTHSNQLENIQMKLLISAKDINPCGAALQKLKCKTEKTT